MDHGHWTLMNSLFLLLVLVRGLLLHRSHPVQSWVAALYPALPPLPFSQRSQQPLKFHTRARADTDPLRLARAWCRGLGGWRLLLLLTEA